MDPLEGLENLSDEQLAALTGTPRESAALAEALKRLGTLRLEGSKERYDRDTEAYRRAIAAVNEMIAENLARRALKSCASMARSG